ncbi:carbohydrate ABC transporter permease [Eubacteriales bacterium mix99]|jgi:putative aldouronate transport system permease protein|nr:sugar ABC transporter permease [Clostridiales bacterium]
MTGYKRKTSADVVFDIVNVLLLLIITILCLYPVWHVVMASFSNPTRLSTHRGVLFAPLAPSTLEGYKVLLKDSKILTSYRNTLVYVGLGTLFNMAFTILGAYTLSRKSLYWKKALMVIITITMFFSGGLIPWFLLVKNIGLYNNLWAMILPTALNTWNMIVLRTGFESVPQDLEEAAEIDGASQAYILFKIIVPLSKPVLAVILLYYFVGNWNSWFNPMILLKDRERFPLQLVIKEILVQNDTAGGATSGGTQIVVSSVQGTTAYRELIKYCTIVISTLPVLCIYPFLQKYFTKGVFVGSLKG